MSCHTLTIDPTGDVRLIYDDELAVVARALGTVSIRRASHVEWLGDGWYADLSPMNGETLGPFDTRGAALAAERDWLTPRI